MRYLVTRLVYLWSLVIPPPQGRHARTTQPPTRRRTSQPSARCQPERASVAPHRAATTTPTHPPLSPRPDRHLVRPYYRAWEQERARKWDGRNRPGPGGLQDVSRPQPPADLGDLTTAVRAWQAFTGVGA